MYGFNDRNPMTGSPRHGDKTHWELLATVKHHQTLQVQFTGIHTAYEYI